MLVQIQGHIIDTQFIYDVTEVHKSAQLFGDRQDAEWCIYFTIESMNQRSKIFIKLPVLNSNINGVAIQPLREKLETARQELIKLWNESKSPIPEIKI